ncbi:hypothetical protein RRG08_005158 [Elysia crispata]|uniref:Uncharacterized protein n=1 Tax=Elysia crispata TaxID=231223 RepID=A0AAE0ZI69_9GAST|nr:hypothetical protein RRG08_005158 [Elysia crispata]
MEEFMKLGKDLGLEGDQLLQFIEKRQAEDFERVSDIRDLILKEQTLNACPKELAAHLREQKHQSLQTLADAAKQYLEAHNMTQKVLTDERHDENTNGRGGAPGHITCFN